MILATTTVENVDRLIDRDEDGRATFVSDPDIPPILERPGLWTNYIPRRWSVPTGCEGVGR